MHFLFLLLALTLTLGFSAKALAQKGAAAPTPEAEKMEEQKKLLEGMLKQLNEKTKEQEEEATQESRSRDKIKNKVELSDFSGTPRLIRDMGYYEVFFIEHKDSFVLAPGNNQAHLLSNLTIAQQKKKKISFRANKANRHIYEVTPIE